ncbi:putative LRR receptor-like serine/threonine-protein kinase [Arachis hypogaea]|nr:putative LRR receptor-like serine/threonine-protein kinase [Arachis hypogaea]
MQATTKGDVYSYGVLTMELATGRRAVDGGEECLVEWTRRVLGLSHSELVWSCRVKRRCLSCYKLGLSAQMSHHKLGRT